MQINGEQFPNLLKSAIDKFVREEGLEPDKERTDRVVFGLEELFNHGFRIEVSPSSETFSSCISAGTMKISGEELIEYLPFAIHLLCSIVKMKSVNQDKNV